MKRLEDIERLSLEELERISENGSITAPEELGERLENCLTAAEMLQIEHPSRSRAWRFSLIPAMAIVAASLVVVLKPSSPKDTFSTPEEAYAQLEYTMGMISKKMNKGKSIADAALPEIEKASEIMDKFYKK